MSLFVVAANSKANPLFVFMMSYMFLGLFFVVFVIGHNTTYYTQVCLFVNMLMHNSKSYRAICTITKEAARAPFAEKLRVTFARKR